MLIMGICASSEITRRRAGKPGVTKWLPTAMVIDLEKGYQEFRQPIKAGKILSQSPKCFLCNSETMLLGSQVPQVSEEEELQLGQIYFLIPISKSQTQLSLQDLCALAIKASSALNNSLSSRTKRPAFRPDVGKVAAFLASLTRLDGFKISIFTQKKVGWNKQVYHHHERVPCCDSS